MLSYVRLNLALVNDNEFFLSTLNLCDCDLWNCCFGYVSINFVSDGGARLLKVAMYTYFMSFHLCYFAEPSSKWRLWKSSSDVYIRDPCNFSGFAFDITPGNK